GGGHPRARVAVECVDHQRGGWRIGLFQHAIAHANAIERMKDTMPELDAIADGAEGRRAFEHADRLPLARERERGGQPAKPATDDEDRVRQDQTALVFSCSQRRLNRLLHVARRRIEASHARCMPANETGSVRKSELNAQFHWSPSIAQSSTPMRRSSE